ncbi:hypothetical protein NTE_02183 [Candidatus Nitrososphaera evergladensis SR1]|uniref:Uncharacterized protein n=1 Tax=Candidatus Nitrososphaera evergladensis SR1 TaxID=1459636 RepID=A0A075MU44_9ARCH|nr:hypothetical protein NTE_02183 [Candidatus Nitrososphaera evergladensis SR1]
MTIFVLSNTLNFTILLNLHNCIAVFMLLLVLLVHSAHGVNYAK